MLSIGLHQDIFLVKYHSSGVKLWTQQTGSYQRERINKVAIDSSNNIYVAGDAWGSLPGFKNSGDGDIILLKFNPDGINQWSKQIGTPAGDFAEALTTDSFNNIYITGYTLGGLDGNTNKGQNDISILKYDSNGNKQ